MLSCGDAPKSASEPEPKYITTQYKELGVVTDLDCRGKRRRRKCDIVTTLTSFDDVRKKDLPGNDINVGDTLRERTDYYDTQLEISLCRNGDCEIQETCYSSDPCWKEPTP